MSDVPSIAIVGRACRVPGASDVHQFLANVYQGVCSIRRFTRAELLAAGVPEATFSQPGFVPASGFLEEPFAFDASFFGIRPQEAAMLDPQQRFILELAYQTVNDAGYGMQTLPQQVGVFVGCGLSAYLVAHAYLLGAQGQDLDVLQLLLGNAQDFAGLNVAYRLNLVGPCVTINTTCSTSLVAVHQACSSLLNYECDAALAGGATFHLLQDRGYVSIEGGIESPDGECRAFDTSANGTVGGSGAAMVMLKRLEDAIQDRDHVYAVIRGSAVNNDGSGKVGFTAPSVQGQCDVIRQALHVAQLRPEEIDYVETHGTGTRLGDVIESTALRQALSCETDRVHPVILGTLKPNIGHLNAASGVIAMIKAADVVQHGTSPPMINLSRVNPLCELEERVFVLPTQAGAWPHGRAVRRAGVSNFGIGGTNAHAILESYENSRPSGPDVPGVCVLSAKTQNSLQSMTSALSRHLQATPELAVNDLAFTLQDGRDHFQWRCAIDFGDRAELLARLSRPAPETQVGDAAPVVLFAFGSADREFLASCEPLYAGYAVFREALHECLQAWGTIVGKRVALDSQPATQLRDLLSADLSDEAAAFAVQYALAQLLRSFGIRGEYAAGVGRGEYVAACVSGAVDLRTALELSSSRTVSRRPAPDRSTLGPGSTALICPWTAADLRYDSVGAAVERRDCGAAGPPFGAAFGLRAGSRLIIVDIGADGALASAAARSGRSSLALGESAQCPDRLRALLHTVARLWERGATVSWRAVRLAEGRRVSLPAYRFDRREFRLRAQSQVGATPPLPAVRPQLYVPAWTADAVTAAPGTTALIVIARALADVPQWLHGEPGCIVVHDNAVFAAESGRVGLDWKDDSQLDRLRQLLSVQQVTTCVYLDGLEPVRRKQELAFQDSVENVRKALWFGRHFRNVHSLVLLQHSASVDGSEPQWPERTIPEALWRSAQQESSSLRATLVDVTGIDVHERNPLRHILSTEASCRRSGLSIAWRGTRRWRSAPAVLELPSARPSVLRKGGVYLITGGFGVLARVIGTYLFDRYGASLVLVGRAGSGTQGEHDWISSLRARGAKVIEARMNLADEHGWTELLARTRRELGGLHGVVLAATTGVKSFALFEKIAGSAWPAEFAAKVHPLEPLERALGEQELDFVICMSTVASILGGLGHGAYAAANRYLDGFVQQLHCQRWSSCRWIAVNWDGWAASAAEPLSQGREALLSDEEGLQAFEAATQLAGSVPQMMVTATPLPERIERWVMLNGASSARVAEDSGGSVLHRLAALWEEALGVAQVGPDDDFFELGGDSLAGLVMIRSVHQQFGCELSLESFLDGTLTLRSMSVLIEQAVDAARWRPLVPLTETRSVDKLFFVHSGGGGILPYTPLAEALKERFECHAIQSPYNAPVDVAPSETLAELGASYLRHVRAVQPNGPYHLAGYSFGGMVAFEMARQLETQGEQVASLIILDTRPPFDTPEKRAELAMSSREILEETAWYLRSLIKTEVASIDFASAANFPIEGQVAHMVDWAKRNMSGASQPQLEFARRYLQHNLTQGHAQMSYVPQGHIRANTLLIRIDDPSYHGSNNDIEDLGWRRWIGGAITVKFVTGAHRALLEGASASAVARSFIDYLMPQETL